MKCRRVWHRANTVCRSTFINDFYDAGGPPNHRDRNLMIETVRVESGQTYGWLDARNAPADHLPRSDGGRRTGHGPRDSDARFPAGRFAGPRKPAEVDRLMKLYDVARGQGDTSTRGFDWPSRRCLCRRSFCFAWSLIRRRRRERRLRAGGVAAGDAPVRALGDYEMASRLSYFLWSSMPDDELLAAAAAGHLHEPADVASQARRMLADPKSRAFVENFSGQWLQLRRLAQLTPDKQLFPDFDAELAERDA